MSSSPPTDAAPAATTATGPGRWRPAGWSLRAQLVATMITLLAVLGLAVGTTVEVTLHQVLYQRVDQQLDATAQLARGGFGQDNPRRDLPPAGEQNRPLPDFRPGQPPRTVRAVITNGQVTGHVLDIVEHQPTSTALPADATARIATLPADGQPKTVNLGALGDYRVVVRGLGATTQVTGVPLDETQRELLLVAGVVAGVTVLALVAAGLAGALIVRRTLAPLSRVAATAAHVSELPLHRGEVDLAQRVPARDTDPRTEVGQVGAALNRMLDHVGDALAARHASETRVRQFVADASHELRTPLASIRGYAELTRRGPARVPDEVAFALGRVEAEAQRMTALVEDLLLLARLDAGRPLQREPVDLTALAVTAVADAHAAGPDHDWRLDLPEEPVTVLGDPARLHQVLANLLANARTHTPAGTAVTVAVTAPADGAVLRVLDTGPGIPAELQPQLFERFTRGDSSRSRAAGSTGLGLSIVAAVVAAHGGGCAVTSVPGRTEVTVRLPASPRAHAVDQDLPQLVE